MALMKCYSLLSLFLIIILSFIAGAFDSTSTIIERQLLALSEDMSIVQSRLYDFYLSNGDCTQTDEAFCKSGGCALTCDLSKSYSANILPNYTWTDVDYADQTTATWLTVQHLDRTVSMLRSYQCSACDSTMYGNASFFDLAVASMNLWTKEDFQNPNWWWMDLGIPQYLATAIILTGNYSMNLSSDDLFRALSLIERAANSTHCGGGQNTVWQNEVLINRDLILYNESGVIERFNKLWSPGVLGYKSATSDGLQYDNSFYQHGSLLQSGAYGADYGLDLLVYAYFATDTSFEITADAMDVLSNFWLDGQQFMIARWNNDRNTPQTYWDISVKCREIARAPVGNQVFNSDPLIPVMYGLTEFPRYLEFVKLADMLSGKGDNFEGVNHFWLSDYTSYHNSRFTISLHMTSNRTYRSESTNGESMTSWHISEGSTFFYISGDEYLSIFPVWNWLQIPGTTTRQNVSETLGNVKLLGLTSFAGGCVQNKLAVSGLDFKSNNFGGADEDLDTVTARKAWFFNDQGLIAIGANISLKLENTPVMTTIDQCLLKDSLVIVSVNGKTIRPLEMGYHSIAGVDWVLHNNILYVMIAPEMNIVIRNAPSDGSWSLIQTTGSTEDVSENTLTIAIDHGFSPISQSYMYAVIPSISNELEAKMMSSSVLNSILFVENRYDAQVLLRGVLARGTDPAYTSMSIVGYSASQVDAGDGWSVSWDLPATVILTLFPDGSLLVSASSPQNVAASLSISINRAITIKDKLDAQDRVQGRKVGKLGRSVSCVAVSASSTKILVTLPEGSLAGSTATGFC